MDIIFWVNYIVEAKISLDIEKIETWESENVIHWYVYLLKHPKCYYYGLTQHKYFAPQMKFWKRTSNFLIESMEDNIDKIYCGTRSIAHL